MNDNQTIAGMLNQAAALLLGQGANPFRVNAYRNAAESIAGLNRSVREIFDAQGTAGLDALPGIGAGLASAIAEILVTGQWSQLERLRGTIDPIATLQTIPGIGPELATKIHDTLHVDTLEALEAACSDGRLATVPGIGTRRAAAISAAVAARLNQRRISGRPRPAAAAKRPAVEMLLDVDREYRHQAFDGSLPMIAPKRFNPEGRAWLPILHTSRDGWHFTALFSNTARAHELFKTRDWVVIYAYSDHDPEQQCTVVTETHGKLRGHRTVRGREAECAAYRKQGPAGEASGSAPTKSGLAGAGR
jgi:hypothetical protein